MTRSNSKKLPESEPHSVLGSQEKLEANSKAESSYTYIINWPNTIATIYGHLSLIYGLFLIFTSAKIQTTLWAFIWGYLSNFGVMAGTHRLWAHRSYKAKWPLRVILIILQSAAMEYSAYGWVRDHRTHHKFLDTNADPYNAKRGFFFSHIGWLLREKHPDVTNKGRSIDMSDLKNDPIVMFQKRYVFWMVLVWAFILPGIVPLYFWNETFNNAYHVAVAFRIVFMLNTVFLVNSAAHYWGNRPYDKYLTAVENPTVAFLASGEGWHNYHHAFPWDYKAAELGNYRANFTTAFIDFFAKIGWAYDLKTAPYSLVYKRAQRTGENAQNSRPAEAVWGWGDESMSEADMEDTVIM